MADDVLLNKAATVERCVARAREEYFQSPDTFATALKRMVAFRNIAVHDYQSLLLPILVNVITQHLDEFQAFTRLLLQRPK